MKTKSRILSLALVAMLCITAIVCIQDDSDTSASDTVTHSVYFEIINDEYSVWKSGWIDFTSTTDGSDFAKKATSAFANAGYSQVKCLVYGKDNIMFNYGSSVSTVCYVGNDQGNRWLLVDNTSEYLTAGYIGLAFNHGYISDAAYNGMSSSEQKAWTSSGMGGGNYAYMKILGQQPSAKNGLMADGIVEHSIYFEIIAPNATVASSGWIGFTSTTDGSDFADKATAAFAGAGYPQVKCQVYGGDYIMFNYGSSVSTVCYVGSNNSDWSFVNNTSEYLTARYIGLALNNGYISDTLYDSLGDAQKESWTSSGMGKGDYAYMKILDQRPNSSDLADHPHSRLCHVYVEVIDENGKIDRSYWFEFEAYPTMQAYTVNANTVFTNGGLPNLQFEVIEFQDPTGKLTYNGEIMNDKFYANGDKWVKVTDQEQLCLNDVTALAVGHASISKSVYDKLSDSDKKSWELDSTTGEYNKVVTVSTSGYEPSSGGNDGNNTGLIIGIVIVVVVVVAAGAFFFVKRK